MFGAALVLALGALVTYGVGADVNQQAMMDSFRKALASAALSSQENQSSSVSHLLIQDDHIPNPSNPFAIGQRTPLSLAASVTRTYRLQDTADTVAELPRMAIDMKGGGECPRGSYFASHGQPRSPCHFLLAGLREEDDIDGFVWDGKVDKFKNDPDRIDPIDRYEEIFGALNIAHLDPSVCHDQPLDPLGRPAGPCRRWGRKIRIIDACAGEILSYARCRRQAEAIADPERCRQQCERDHPTGGADCQTICAQRMSRPWYARGEMDTSGQWSFLELDDLFRDLSVSWLGVQPGWFKVTEMNNLLAKREDAAHIETTAHINWRDDITRYIAYRPYHREGGGAPAVDSVTATPIDARDLEGDTWSVPW